MREPCGNFVPCVVVEPWTVPSKVEAKVCQFYFIHDGQSLKWCVASMNVIPLLGCVCNGISIATMPPQMDWEGYQHMYG